MRVAETILWQHAQLAAFLWAQREALAAAMLGAPGIKVQMGKLKG